MEKWLIAIMKCGNEAIQRYYQIFWGIWKRKTVSHFMAQIVALDLLHLVNCKAH